MPISETQTQKVTIFAIESYPIFRIGLEHCLNSCPEFEWVGQSDRFQGTSETILKSRPDLVILNISLPDGSGLEIVKSLRAANYDGCILVLSENDENLYAERCLRAGANGYATKLMPVEQVLDGIRTVLRGEVFVSEQLNAKLLRRISGNGSEDNLDRIDRLTDREFQVLELIGMGLKTSEIAARLGISTKTVDVHRGNIKPKLGIDDLNELIRYAVQWLETGGVAS